MKVLKKSTTKTGNKIKRKTNVEVTKPKLKKLQVKKSAEAAKIRKPKKATNEGSTRKTKSKSAKTFESIKDIDPELYAFLQKNDKELLEFNLLDASDDERDEEQRPNANTDEVEQSDDDDVDDADDAAEKQSNSDNEEHIFHKPNAAALEVASDESDFEEDATTTGTDGVQKVTLNLLRQWQMQLEVPNVAVQVVRNVIKAFNSALASISADAEERNASALEFKVEGAAVFNGVIQLCVLHLQPAILRILGLDMRSKKPLHKCKKWPKLRTCLRFYLSDLIQLIEQVSSAHILSVLLKHLHQMAGMLSSFSNISKIILKRLVVLWATSDETVRVLAFLCILKITRNQQVSMLNHVLKAMYLSYVRNSKFVSPSTLPSINFMRRSLVEMFALDLNVSYQHVFLYIRQLAIHLRNAVILKKKDSFQSVYNWQYINSIRLWAELLGSTADKPQLQPLVYPLVTITLGVIRLIPTAQYFPLRFHCLHTLISLSKEANVFMPLLPLILEVLKSNTFNKKHTNVSMRPMQFSCILRLNKTQLSENGFRDEVVEQVFALCLEYLAHHSASLAYADMIVPAVIALKTYLKSCRNANHARKLKQLLDKMQDNARFIEQQRQNITFALNELQQVAAWETKVRNKGTPLDIYYNSWVKTNETKKRRQAAQSDVINADNDVPMIKRQKTNKTSVAVRNEQGEIELFPSDSEQEEEPAAEEQQQRVKTKQNKKKKVQKSAETSAMIGQENKTLLHDEPEDDAADEVDIVKDLDLDDW